MTEVVCTLTGMKVASKNDDGARYYRKAEVDAFLDDLERTMRIYRGEARTASVSGRDEKND